MNDVDGSLAGLDRALADLKAASVCIPSEEFICAVDWSVDDEGAPSEQQTRKATSVKGK